MRILSSFYNECFFKLLLEELIRRQIHLFTSKVLHSEAHSPQLDRVELLDLVVKLAVSVLE